LEAQMAEKMANLEAMRRSLAQAQAAAAQKGSQN
jgi:hypothetical protein